MLMLLNIHGYYSMTYTSEARWLLVGLVFIGTGLLPGLLMVMFYRLRLVSSLEMNNREERLIPLIVYGVFIYMVYHLIHSLQLPSILYLYLFGGFLVCLMVVFINVFWKISLHMTGIGSATGVFLALSMRVMVHSYWLLIALILLGGLIGVARMKLRAHTPAQIYAGYVLGVSVMMVLYLQ